MDLQKFTDRARGFIQAAQTIAMREGHQRLGAEHLLKALLDDSEGLASSLIQRAGGDPKRAAEAADAAVARQPKVSGGDGQIYMEQSLGRAPRPDRGPARASSTRSSAATRRSAARCRC
jgi:ATP-dependent Clp protease ATP-binding subunit ClpB